MTCLFGLPVSQYLNCDPPVRGRPTARRPLPEVKRGAVNILDALPGISNCGWCSSGTVRGQRSVM